MSVDAERANLDAVLVDLRRLYGGWETRRCRHGRRLDSCDTMRCAGYRADEIRAARAERDRAKGKTPC